MPGIDEQCASSKMSSTADSPWGQDVKLQHETLATKAGQVLISVELTGLEMQQHVCVRSKQSVQNTLSAGFVKPGTAGVL